MSTPPAAVRAHSHVEVSEQWAWIAGGLVFAFLVSFLLADVLALQRDLYYGLYALLVASFLGAWARAGGFDLRATLSRNWRWGLALGLVSAGVMAAIVVGSEHATPHPGGLAFAGAILWRGVVYGAVDGLLLSVFPILAVFAAFRREGARRGVLGTIAVGAVALAVSLGMTASYHLGYSDFRSQKVTKTLVGDAIWSAPTLVTLSPLGAPTAHIGQHVAAVVHSYQTELFLPPHR